MDFELIKRKIMLGGFYVIRRVTRPFLEEDIENMRDILLLALNKQMSMLWTAYVEGHSPVSPRQQAEENEFISQYR